MGYMEAEVYDDPKFGEVKKKRPSRAYNFVTCQCWMYINPLQK